jgi:hypothetical protein
VYQNCLLIMADSNPHALILRPILQHWRGDKQLRPDLLANDIGTWHEDLSSTSMPRATVDPDSQALSGQPLHHHGSSYSRSRTLAVRDQCAASAPSTEANDIRGFKN